MTFTNAFKNYPVRPTDKPAREMTGMQKYFEKMKKDFKVYYSDTLFEPTFEDLRTSCQEKRCLVCNCKLYLMRNRPLYYCKSVKHKKKFIISQEKLEKISKM